VDAVLTAIDAATHGLWTILKAPILGPAGSIATLLLFPTIAMIYLALVSRFSLRRFRWVRVFRAHFDPRFMRKGTHLVDIAFLIGNAVLFSVLLGAAIVSAIAVATLAKETLALVFGVPSGPLLGRNAAMVSAAITVILAYEFAYWLDHYLAHRIPFLWEFHKVHHAADALTPLTVFRVHPVDTLVYYNISAVVTGLALGLLWYAFGDDPVTNPAKEHRALYLLIAMHLLGYFQHSQIWVPLTGWLGRLILSPAHHQIHHSNDARHHDRNFGNFLAVFDWAFGTLYVPSRKREKLTFGVDGLAPDNITDNALKPFATTADRLMPGNGAPAPAEAARRS
jgi:sterol desaturase/sphingolipid hydroxylase (fatty acid hydroxylase superfamily)